MRESRASNELADFRHARDRLRLDNATMGVPSGLRPLFSAATLVRLLKSEAEYPSQNFSAAIQQRLLWAQRGPQDQGVYGSIEYMMGGSKLGREIIRTSFTGEYSLFRFTHRRGGDFSSSDRQVYINNESMELEFIEERVKIFFDEIDEPAFAYWGLGQDGDPEISGGVFYTLGKLFLAGAARDTMSMAILQVLHMGEPLHGFWTSTLSVGMRPPFSARVLMVQAENETLLETLRDHEHNTKAFFEMTQGGYSFYQTIL